MAFWDWLLRPLGHRQIERDRIYLTEESLLQGLIPEIREDLAGRATVLATAHFTDDLGVLLEEFSSENLPVRPWTPPPDREGIIRELQSSAGEILMLPAHQLPALEAGQNLLPVVSLTCYVLHHHPLAARDQRIADFIRCFPNGDLTYYTSMDHPLFRHYGGESLQEVLKMLGMKAQEAIEHPMLTRNIRSAQRVLAREVPDAADADSAQEWFERNLPGSRSSLKKW